MPGKLQKWVMLAGMVFYLAVPVLLMVIPVSFFESRQPVCIFRNIFGVHCPGCGMIRAVSCVFHADFKKAIGYNRLVIIVLPLLGYIWLKGVLSGLKYFSSNAFRQE